MTNRLVAVLVAAGFFASSPVAAQSEPRPRDALSAVIGAFDTHSAVLLGEVHYSVAQHAFIQKLLEDKRLPQQINDIAVEFANARYQPLLDRYVAGETVPGDSLKQVWENVIVPMAWDYALYPRVFSTVRRINQSLPLAKRLRVLALDPPIPWDSIRTAEDIPRRWGYRDPSWTDVLEREVFAKHRKVLVICGGVHLLRLEPTSHFKPAPIERAGLGDALAQLHPGQIYSIYPVVGMAGLGSLTRTWPRNTSADIRGTTLGARNSHILLPGNIVAFTMVNGTRVPHELKEAEFPPIEAMVDALAYYGTDSRSAPQVLSSYRDPAYVAELHRRSAIVQPIFGQNLDGTIDSLARVARRRK